MTILGSEFAVILLASAGDERAEAALAAGAKRLEREHGLTILLRPISDSPRPPVPAPGTHLRRVVAAGEDRAGIVAGVCRVLAEHGANVAELSSVARPGPGGSPHFEMSVTIELPEHVAEAGLHAALQREADRLVIDVALVPA